MNKTEILAPYRPVSRRILQTTAVACLVLATLLYPEVARDTFLAVVSGFVSIASFVIPGILISAWVNASGAGSHLARVFEGSLLVSVLLASAAGSVTPVCGAALIPLLVGLLLAGVPFAPIMAFWLSSPITDPTMFAATSATLGFKFALGKTIAAFGIGFLGGIATGSISRDWVTAPLRIGGETRGLEICGQCKTARRFVANPLIDALRRKELTQEVLATTRLIAICLVPAFAAEHLLDRLLQPESLTQFIGVNRWWSVPVAVLVGAPSYFDGYSALPLIRGLIDHGMSQAAAMAFLVSGGIMSIWGAIAVFPVLKIKPFLLFMALATLGSLASGWLFGLFP